MKLTNTLSLAICATLAVAACKKGDAGVDGANGNNGKNALTRTSKEAAGAHCPYGGTKLETGLDANENGKLDDNEVTTTQTEYICNGSSVIYSSWIDVNVDSNHEDVATAYKFDFVQHLPTTGITAEVINQSAVLLYYRDKQGTIVPVERDDFYPINDYNKNDVLFSFAAGFAFKQNYFGFFVNSYYDKIDKSWINDNGSAVRYIIIPGAIPVRSAELKKLSYKEVANLYDIKD